MQSASLTWGLWCQEKKWSHDWTIRATTWILASLPTLPSQQLGQEWQIRHFKTLESRSLFLSCVRTKCLNSDWKMEMARSRWFIFSRPYLVQPTVLSTVALMLQACIRRLSSSSVCRLWHYVLWLNDASYSQSYYRAYRKSYMGNRLVSKWMTLTFV